MFMMVPSAYECELESLIRERDKQISHLKAQVSSLRTPPPTESHNPWAELIVPYIHAAHTPHPPSSSTLTAALTQRAKILQQENDQLYDLLKLGETGKLKEQVYGLNRVVTKLEHALKESHQVITSLSNELDKSYDAFTLSSSPPQRAPSHNSSSASRPPPTGPRALKKQRLSDPQSDSYHPPPRHSSHWQSSRNNNRDHPPPPHMDVDQESLRSPHSDRWEKDRDRDSLPSRPERERERGRKDKYRDKDRDIKPARSRNGGGRGGRTSSRRRSDAVETSTLAERMGIN